MALHCPATLFLARHGSARYEQPDVLSDEPGRLATAGREQVIALGRCLEPERIARVYCSPMGRAVQSAELLAGILGVDVEVDADLRELSVGDLAGGPQDGPEIRGIFAAWRRGELAVRVPGAQSGQEAVARLREALSSIADRHRGERVAVISHGGLLQLALPRLADNTRDDLGFDAPLGYAEAVRLEIGDDGWRLTGWPAPATGATP